MSRWFRKALKQAEFDFDSRSTYGVKLSKICDLRKVISKVKDKQFAYIKRTLENTIYNEGNWEIDLLDIFVDPFKAFSIDEAFIQLIKERSLVEEAIYDVTIQEMVPGTKEPKEPEVTKKYYICLFVSKDKLYDKLSDVIEAITSKLNGINKYKENKNV
jgi:hypothetical protein